MSSYTIFLTVCALPPGALLFFSSLLTLHWLQVSACQVCQDSWVAKCRVKPSLWICLLRGGYSGSGPAGEAVSLLQGRNDPLQFTTARKSCITTVTFPSEKSGFLGYKSKSQIVALKPVMFPLPQLPLKGCLCLPERPQSLGNLQLDQDSPSFPFQPAFPAHFPQFSSPAQLLSDIRHI